MQKDTCARSLQPFTITRRRKQPKCPSTDEWIKTWYNIYNGLSPNHKRNDTGSFVLTWWDLESVLQSEVSKKEENQYHILRHKCGTQKNDSDEPICWAGIETQRERTDGCMGGEKGWGESGDWNWCMCIAVCETDSQWETALQLRELNWVPRGELEGWAGWGEGGLREGAYACMQLTCFVVQQKLAQQCKGIIPQ